MNEIHTERLILRPFREEEADMLGRFLDDRRVFFWRDTPTTEQELEAILKSSATLRGDGMGWFAIHARDDHRFVGDVILQPLAETGEIEVGYHLLPEEWGKGYATEAAEAMLDYGFNALGLPRIVAVVLPENGRSRGVIDRLGLTYIEDLIHADLLHRYYAISRDDYLTARKAAMEQPGI